MNKKGLSHAMLLAFAAFAEGGLLDIGYKHPDRKVKLTNEELANLKRSHRMRKIARMKKRGANLYSYGRGKSVFARNQENADKKARKKGWIK